MAKLIIKGAIYKSGDTLLRAHFTGEFNTVDCTEFKIVKEIKAAYSKELANQFIKEGYYLEHDGVKYYECEYGPYHCEDFELLSDLSTLEFYDNETSF